MSMFEIGALVRTVGDNRAGIITDDSWFIRLDRPEDIDLATNSIILVGFNNIDYAKWPENMRSDVFIDMSNSPLSRHRLSAGSIGIVVGTILVKYAKIYKLQKEAVHWKVLVSEHIYLIPHNGIKLMKK